MSTLVIFLSLFFFHTYADQAKKLYILRNDVSTYKSEPDICLSECSGAECHSKCMGPESKTRCNGDKCISSCSGKKCTAFCFGKDCRSLCEGSLCVMRTNGEKATQELSTTSDDIISDYFIGRSKPSADYYKDQNALRMNFTKDSKAAGIGLDGNSLLKQSQVGQSLFNLNQLKNSFNFISIAIPNKDFFKNLTERSGPSNLHFELNSDYPDSNYKDLNDEDAKYEAKEKGTGLLDSLSKAKSFFDFIKFKGDIGELNSDYPDLNSKDLNYEDVNYQANEKSPGLLDSLSKGKSFFDFIKFKRDMGS